MKGQPDFAGNGEHCLNMYNSNGLLNDLPCSYSGVVPLCKTSATAWSQNIQKVQPTVASCPSGWSYFNGHCYYIVNSGMTQWQAQAYCSILYSGSFLIQMTSTTEYNWVASFVQSNSNNHIWVNKEI